MKNESCYLVMRKRITQAQDAQVLRRLEDSTTRLYNAGQLSISEFRRLDVRIMEKLATLTE